MANPIDELIIFLKNISFCAFLPLQIVYLFVSVNVHPIGQLFLFVKNISFLCILAFADCLFVCFNIYPLRLLNCFFSWIWSFGSDEMHCNKGFLIFLYIHCYQVSNPSGVLYVLKWIKKLRGGLFAVFPGPYFLVYVGGLVAVVVAVMGLSFATVFQSEANLLTMFYILYLIGVVSLIKWRTSCTFIKWNWAQHKSSNSRATKQIESLNSFLCKTKFVAQNCLHCPLLPL